MTTICASAHNEGPYLVEWVAYHRTIGIRRFVIYDNESTDETTSILLKLEDAGLVERVPWLTPDRGSPQLTAYWDFILRNRAETDFAAFVDLDEFIAVPEEFSTLDEYLDSNQLRIDGVGAIAINQRIFGSAGYSHFEDRLVTERFTKTAFDSYDENKWFKTICRPACTAAVPGPHAIRLLTGRYVNCFGQDLNRDEIEKGKSAAVFDGLRVNHYILKSLEEFRLKQTRGGGAGATLAIRMARYDDGFFYGRDNRINDVDWSFSSVRMDEVKQEYGQIMKMLGGGIRHTFSRA